MTGRHLSLGDGELPVQSPDFREARRVEALALFRQIAERVGRLPQVVLEEPGLGERRPKLQRLVTGQSRLLLGADEQRRGVGAVAVLERIQRLGKCFREWHLRVVYRVYTGRD